MSLLFNKISLSVAYLWNGSEIFVRFSLINELLSNIRFRELKGLVNKFNLLKLISEVLNKSSKKPKLVILKPSVFPSFQLIKQAFKINNPFLGLYKEIFRLLLDFFKNSMTKNIILANITSRKSVYTHKYLTKILHEFPYTVSDEVITALLLKECEFMSLGKRLTLEENYVNEIISKGERVSELKELIKYLGNVKIFFFKPCIPSNKIQNVTKSLGVELFYSCTDNPKTIIKNIAKYIDFRGQLAIPNEVYEKIRRYVPSINELIRKIMEGVIKDFH